MLLGCCVIHNSLSGERKHSLYHSADSLYSLLARYMLLLRGAMVNRTYGKYETLYTYLFLLLIP